MYSQPSGRRSSRIFSSGPTSNLALPVRGSDRPPTSPRPGAAPGSASFAPPEATPDAAPARTAVISHAPTVCTTTATMTNTASEAPAVAQTSIRRFLRMSPPSARYVAHLNRVRLTGSPSRRYPVQTGDGCPSPDHDRRMAPHYLRVLVVRGSPGPRPRTVPGEPAATSVDPGRGVCAGAGRVAPMSVPLRQRLRDALPAAMKARDRVVVSALRATLAAIENAEATAPATDRGMAIERSPVGVGAAEARRRGLTEAPGEQIVGAAKAGRGGGPPRDEGARPPRPGPQLPGPDKGPAAPPP